MSIRNFRVAGIRGLPDVSDVVSIQTAVQVAIEYQVRGMESVAEKIYTSILDEVPTNTEALHLLGVIHYQKGDSATAIPYIEKALEYNNTFEGFHNTLGMD